MKYQAKWNNHVIAEAEEDMVLHIEGNVYFPSESVVKDYFTPSDTHSTCPWKGEASYYNLEIEGQENKDAAWYYPQPKEGSPERVSTENEGKYDGDFSNFVAFWNGVTVEKVE